ncbi:DUF5011 domain-containing protein [Luteolibacter marinus]|uniref:DUF5011 domain-containing protein n=1 Tax=Luteolibacter marinus TaxID=2776705 RepID=UPI001868FD44|nr:DUF5011 domain-containing protein [Luteolibacter marinus]
MKPLKKFICHALAVLALASTAPAENLPGDSGVEITLQAQGIDANNPRSASGYTYDIPTDQWPEYLSFLVEGADGGTVDPVDAKGGAGAQIYGLIQIGYEPGDVVQPGGQLRFLPGVKGQSISPAWLESRGAGGGGGSGILYKSPDPGSTWVPLVIAGGGGGAVKDWTGLDINYRSGGDGQTGTAGQDTDTTSGGVDGQGGGGAGGGGWLSDGSPAAAARRGRAGSPNGGLGGEAGTDGVQGGWGCGGGAGSSASSTVTGGGGGGGYSGGGSGSDGGSSAAHQGGGGGSYVHPGIVNLQSFTGERDDRNGEIVYLKGSIFVNNPPAITINGGNVTIAYLSTYTDAGATAVDGLGESLTVNASGVGNVDTSTPGVYQITYSATDRWGRTSSAIRYVTVELPAPPTVTVNGSSPLAIPYLSTYTDAGATATGEGGLSLTVNVSGLDAVDTSIPGPYQIIYSATDRWGRTSSALRNLIVELPDPPTITVTGSTSVTVPYLSTYTDAGATATDGGGQSLTVNVSGVGSVDTSVPNSYTITYSATDAWAQTSTATRTVTVSKIRIYVDASATGANDGTSWTDAYTSLQDALGTMVPTAYYEIWVADGTYKTDSGTNRSASFVLGDFVALYGGFAGGETDLSQRNLELNRAILSGDIDNNGYESSGDAHHVVRIVNASSATTLDGFIVRHGHADDASTTDGTYGGGLLLDNASPRIVNVRFLENYAEGGGGAVAALTPIFGALFDFCTFENNETQGTGSALHVDALSFFPFTVHHSRFADNSSFSESIGSGASVEILRHAATLIDCVIAGNNSGGSFAGLHVDGAGVLPIALELINLTIAGNEAGAECAGLAVGLNVDLVMANTLIWGNEVLSPLNPDWANYRVSAGATSAVSYSLVEGSSTAALGGTGNLDGTNPANDPRFNDVAGGVPLDSPVVNQGSNAANPIASSFDSVDADGHPRIAQSVIDIGAIETVAPVYVDASASGADDGSSWTNAYTSLATALAAQIKDGTYYIAAGTYTPGTLRSDSFSITRSLSLYGGFPAGGAALSARDPQANPTILSGDIGSPGISSDNVYHVVRIDNGIAWADEFEGTVVLLDGLVIRDGYADDGSGGGGIVTTEDLRLEHCTVEQNFSQSNGGGLAASDHSGLSVHASRFSANESAGSGGALHMDSATIDAFSSFFTGNEAAGTGNGGAACLFNTTADFASSVFSGNRAGGTGGAIDSSGTGAEAFFLFNTTVSGNAASGDGGGIYVQGANSFFGLTNTVVWNNSANGSAADASASIGGSVPSFTFYLNSLAEHMDLPAGDGNLDGTLPANDPQFLIPVDPATAPTTAGDLRVAPLSPLVDAGESEEVNSRNLVDAAGNPRILGAAVDIGAYERQGLVYVDASATGANDGSSWTDAFTTLDPALALVNSTSADRPDEVWIAEGTYSPASPWDGLSATEGFPIVNTVNLRGGFPAGGSSLAGQDPVSHPTILTINGSYGRVLTIDDSDDGTLQSILLDSLIVTGGNSIFDSINSENGRGGGIYSRENLTLREATVAGNTGGFSGGGVYITVGTLQVEDSLFDQNSAGPDTASVPKVGGGAIRLDTGSSLVALRSSFSQNQALSSVASGGAVAGSDGTILTLTNCAFRGNQTGSTGGALYLYNVALTSTNCLFSGNKSDDGGGAFVTGPAGTFDFINATFSGNRVSGNGGGLRINGGTCSLKNTLVWNNLATGAATSDSHSISDATVGVTSYQNTLAEFIDLTGVGTANVDGTLPGNDPAFIQELDPTTAPSVAGDFRFYFGSPVFEKGDNSLNSESTDLAGSKRIGGVNIDLGAYEALDRVAPVWPYDQWIQAWFPAETDPAIIGIDADPNHDGISNGLAFLTALSPVSSSPEALGVITVSGNTTTISFRRSDRGLSLKPTYEVSFDLSTWLDPATAGSGVQITIHDDAYGTDFEGYGIDEVLIEADTTLVPKLFARQVFQNSRNP